MLQAKFNLRMVFLTMKGNFSIAFSRLSLLEDGNEQADLCIIKVVPSYNLSIDSVNFDHSKVIPGTQLAIDVEVTNNGEIGVEELVVDILDGDEIINSEAVQISLKPGESKTATVLMNLPDTIAKKAYSIRVSTVEGENTTQMTMLNSLQLAIPIFLCSLRYTVRRH